MSHESFIPSEYSLTNLMAKHLQENNALFHDLWSTNYPHALSKRSNKQNGPLFCSVWQWKFHKNSSLFPKLIIVPFNLKKTLNETYSTHFEAEYTVVLDIF